MMDITKAAWEPRTFSDGSVGVGHWDMAGIGWVPVALNVRSDCAGLVSAAPELLAACKLALAAFEQRAAINWDDLARAIAKAEGTDA